ncbi:MAG: SMP-30/gluconolactonase/LRE family protein [Chloroflexi bacterium]|nr:SMP-30/gluconolactonase/LRE family protein [Chloroflexota bacterium]MYD64960.1 SMP-30/gluconolactonase/LRE family protein [Chloroflexota bacterium]
MAEYQSTVLLDGLRFGEGPRWRDGKLWFSDMQRYQVMTVDPDGNAEVVVHVPERPSGLGWRPDGTLLIVSMEDRKLMRHVPPDGLEEVADLSSVATWHCNDMVVDARGRAYVGNFGSDTLSGDEVSPAAIALVTEDNEVRMAADNLEFPNGTVISPDGRTLIVAESRGGRLTAFDVADDGGLSGRRVFADFDEVSPDGICLDAEGGVWVSNPLAPECIRVLEGGEVTDRVSTEHNTYACMLGGDGGTTLYICSADANEADWSANQASGFIEVVEVAVPHAGLP